MTTPSSDHLLDLVIIGASAVGSAASIYAARRNLKFVVVSTNIGGEVALSGEVENWPGTVHTTGVELAKQFETHARFYNTPIENGWNVTTITQEKNYHIVHAVNDAGETKTFETKAVLIGSGIHPRLLGVPGEEALKNKGITYCTVCDGPLYRNKITVTIGAGNSALESALMMAGISKKVYFITKYPNTTEFNGGFPKGENILIEKVKALPNIEIIYEANTKKILGADVAEGVVYEDATGKEQTIAVNGVMIHIGNIPNSDFATGIAKNEQKEIIVDMIGRTNIPGIFAAGDVTNIPYKQIVIAAGMGVTAALSAIDYLNRWQEV